MAVDGDPEDSVSSVGLDSGEVEQNGDAPSAEDVAWADSCLAVNSVSESGWESLRDALLDALDSQSDSLKHEKHDFCSDIDVQMIKLSKLTENAVSFSDGADTEMIKSSKLTENDVNSPDEADTEMFGSSQMTENVNSSDGADTEMISSSKLMEHAVNISDGADIEMISSGKDAETSVNSVEAVDNGASFINDSNSGTENSDTSVPGFYLDNVFLPTYNENHRNIGFSDPEFESAFSAFVIDGQSREDIFKVWELESSGDDEEFINELDKALSEKQLEPLAAVSEVSGSSDDLKELNALISGIGDLSLVEGV